MEPQSDNKMVDDSREATHHSCAEENSFTKIQYTYDLSMGTDNLSTVSNEYINVGDDGIDADLKNKNVVSNCENPVELIQSNIGCENFSIIILPNHEKAISTDYLSAEVKAGANMNVSQLDQENQQYDFPVGTCSSVIDFQSTDPTQELDFNAISSGSRLQNNDKIDESSLNDSKNTRESGAIINLTLEDTLSTSIDSESMIKAQQQAIVKNDILANLQIVLNDETTLASNLDEKEAPIQRVLPIETSVNQVEVIKPITIEVIKEVGKSLKKFLIAHVVSVRNSNRPKTNVWH
ncbi:uncharacterized protein LOC116346277 [Contarinia nasturtii]|uniref:uncharacterized protein LOC116346277 n=1 Tax=Contarinia nasturtii TaxID=265458 RepID=UPI0012D3BA2F|nr:uncharacterized protein LOC116346277 [Contarinia nasturtii]XP_031632081.1 uncharacterized protein LOC116346277 [Contarinia nasturtii]